MSRGIVTKFVAFVLAALTLVAAAASMVGIAVLSYQGLYDVSFEEYRQNQLRSECYYTARNCVRDYAAKQLGNCPQNVLEELYGSTVPAEDWSAVILLDGEILSEIGTEPKNATQLEYSLSVSYPVIPETGARSMDVTAQTEGSQSPSYTVTVLEDGNWVEYTLHNRQSPEYTVILSLAPSITEQLASDYEWALISLLYEQRYLLIAYAGAGLFLFAACAVYLCCAAARAPGSPEIRPGGLNRLPLDLYAAIVGGMIGLCGVVGLHLLEWTFNRDANYGGIILCCILAVILSLLLIAFCFALAAQLKTRNGYWWRNSIIGRCILIVVRCARWVFGSIVKLVSLLPVIWQWLLTAAVMALSLLLGLIWATNTYHPLREFWVLLIVAVCAGVVCYGGYAFGTLLSGVIRMNRGDLDHKIPTTFLVGSFRDFAVALNGLSESAMIAAQKQLKSERMKTELITNVSHDIKTPLTSIINYVDLLEKPHTEEEQRMYLDVLSRQSLRLKKLIDDLMEMSKASTGNLTVDIAKIDAVEAVNQALGEFSGKLSAARLIPVFSAPAEPITMLADGRLVWRVLSNLLGNAVKYALPGTRVYIDTAQVDGQVLISIKNISKEQLNVSSEELMERFVRGDASRNTEGSGLGLNIAKSLMEVQKGNLTLLVDGDLFKVTLLFPAA